MAQRRRRDDHHPRGAISPARVPARHPPSSRAPHHHEMLVGHRHGQLLRGHAAVAASLGWCEARCSTVARPLAIVGGPDRVSRRSRVGKATKLPKKEAGVRRGQRPRSEQSMSYCAIGQMNPFGWQPYDGKCPTQRQPLPRSSRTAPEGRWLQHGCAVGCWRSVEHAVGRQASRSHGPGGGCA